jgi:hypothetical protein
MALLLVSIFCFQATKASALEAKFEFYYQSREEVKTINEPIEEDDSLWTKVKKTVKKGTNAIKRLWEKGVTRNIAPGEGEKTWYSEGDKNTAYTVKRTKVTTEEELLTAMGVKSESELNDGQKALLAVFRKSKSQAIADEAKIAYIPTVKVYLSDTTGYDDKSKYPNVTKDFWPYSSGLAINMSSNNYNYAGGDKDAESTFVHEYAHCLDATFKELRHPYGLDGSHYGNEITGKRAAFVEAWAEYNEMIASEDEAKAILKRSEVLCEESKTEAGSYTWNIKQEDCTADQLMRSEAHLAKLLYRLTTETENGKEKVYKAFTSTRLNVFRDMTTLVKKFIKQNPEDTETVCKIVDEVFLGKMTDEEFLDYVGKTDATKAYVENRGKTTTTDEADTEVTVENNDTEVKTSEEKINVETSNGNPFSED